MRAFFASRNTKRRASAGWAEIDELRKRDIVQAIETGRPTCGPSHLELDVSDRCNAACYFCNQRDLRSSEEIPLPRLVRLIDEVAATGLRSVRLSGGGEPLIHSGIHELLDHLARRRVVVDNLTTNGIALDDLIAERLVRDEAREVIVSLNSVDADDYARMMHLPPRIFDRVTENIARLVAIRGKARFPAVVVQFLFDRTNASRLAEAYALGRSLGADFVAPNAVSPVPNGRMPADLILTGAEISGLLPLNKALREAAGFRDENDFPTAPSFRPENGGCFFGWYTAAITASGAVYPCCLLLSPDVKPLGFLGEDGFLEIWRGRQFDRLREEMRRALVDGGRVPWSSERYRVLPRGCVDPGSCALKNMFFRHDRPFYRSLGVALERMRDIPVRQ